MGFCISIKEKNTITTSSSLENQKMFSKVLGSIENKNALQDSDGDPLPKEGFI